MTFFLSLLTDEKLRRVTTWASMAVASVLILAKIGAYLETGSVALLSSLLDSGVDLLASMITAYGVAKAAQPPDKDHRFGHGKAEALAAIAQAAFIIGSSAFLVVEAMQRFIVPRALENIEAGYSVMGFAIVLTLLLLALQSYTVTRTQSLAIASDRLHYVGDVLINLAVVATFSFDRALGLPWVDPLFALLIAGAMIISAIRIGRRALDVLMDAELPEEERKAILDLASSVEGVRGIHDLRTRSDSGRLFIEMHVEMNPAIELRDAHAISERVIAAVRVAHQDADIQIHQDPVGIKEERLDALIEKESS
jgi:ferrous-iron efflux pump FieF